MSTSLVYRGSLAGTLGYEFLKVAEIYIENTGKGGRVLHVEQDGLRIDDCQELGKRINEILQNKEQLLTDTIPKSGNDKRYTNTPLANALGVSQDSSEYELLKAFANALENNGCEVAILDPKLAITIPSLLKANFYEYGKAFLHKPEKNFVYADKASAVIILLGFLGALISYAGKVETNEAILYKYLIVSESLKPQFNNVRDNAISAYRYIYSNQEFARRSSDIAKNLYLLTSLVLNLNLREGSLGKLVSISKGKSSAARLTIIKVEDINTFGLVDILSRIKVEMDRKGFWLTRVFKCFLEAPLHINPNSREFSTILNLTNIVANLVFTYTQTRSVESLLLANRLIEQFVSPQKLNRDEIQILEKIWGSCLGREEANILDLANNLKEFFTALRLYG